MRPESSINVDDGQPQTTADRHYSRWLAYLPQMCAVVDQEGKLLYGNLEWCTITGIAAETITSHSFWSLVHTHEELALRKIWQQAILQRRPLQINSRIRHTNGSYWPYLVQVRPAGEEAEWIVTCTDMPQSDKTEVLSENQEFLQCLLSNLSDAVVACDTQGKLVVMNKAAQRLHGLGAEPVSADLWAGYYSLYRADGRTPMKKEEVPLYRALQGEVVQDVEMVIAPAEGVVVPNENPKYTLLCDSVPILAADGRKLGAVAVMRNITERKQAEAARSEMQLFAERLLLALGAAEMGSWDWDVNSPSGRVYWSPYHEIIFGYEPGQPERSYADWERCVHPEDLDWVNETVNKAKDNHEDYAIQYRILWPDGSLHWVDARGRFHYDAQGEPVRMVGLLRDVTKQKRMREDARESEERFRATFEQAAIGVAHIGHEGHWLRVNQKLCSIIGYTHEELSGMTWQQITHPEDLETDLQHVQQLLAGTIHTYSMEKRYVRKDGSITWANITVSLVKESLQADLPGTPKYFIVAIEQIDERKQIELDLHKRAQELLDLNAMLTKTTALLEERNRELDQFTYVVSHDLKAPLRAVTNLSQWIEEDLEGQLAPEGQHQMNLLRGRIHRMENLINGLLEYSRAGRSQILLETVDVQELVAEIIDSLAPPAGFTVEIQPGTFTLHTKRLLLRQVLTNLIGNAIKHHDRPAGHVWISVEAQEQKYRFSVKDDGHGIEPEYHQKIFDMFQTLEARDITENTGVGLTIVKKIVESEGGIMHLESQLGTGSIFSFTWPV
jgi:PAS domain S-box-containing protein